jgi:hypothetical protein
MPRGSQVFNEAASEETIEDVIFVRVLNLPRLDDPTITVSLYMTDAVEPVTFYDESGYPKTYEPVGLTYEPVEQTIENTIDSAVIRLDNVNRDFSAYAQYYRVQDTEVHVLRGLRSALNSIDGAQMIFVGFIQQATIGEHNIEFSVWPDYTLKLKVPRRRYWVNLFPYLPASKDVRYVQRV